MKVSVSTTLIWSSVKMIEELKELRAGRDRSKYPARLLILDMVRDEEIDRVIAELWEAYNAR